MRYVTEVTLTDSSAASLSWKVCVGFKPTLTVYWLAVSGWAEEGQGGWAWTVATEPLSWKISQGSQVEGKIEVTRKKKGIEQISNLPAPLLSPCCRRTPLPECFLFIRRLAEGAEGRESWLLIHCGKSYEKSTVLGRTFFNHSAGETKTHRRGNRCLHIYESQILYFVWEEAERGEAALLTLSLMLSLQITAPPFDRSVFIVFSFPLAQHFSISRLLWFDWDGNRRAEKTVVESPTVVNIAASFSPLLFPAVISFTLWFLWLTSDSFCCLTFQTLLKDGETFLLCLLLKVQMAKIRISKGGCLSLSQSHDVLWSFTKGFLKPGIRVISNHRGKLSVLCSHQADNNTFRSVWAGSRAWSLSDGASSQGHVRRASVSITLRSRRMLKHFRSRTPVRP